MSTTSISDSEFNSSVINQRKTAAVVFWASWDGGSRSFMPIFEQVAIENRFKLAFYKMDVDVCSSTVLAYSIRSVPTVVLLKAGQLSGQLVGAVTKAKLNMLIGGI
ncbi:MAG TPA: thioredoxin domain-containing protein [Pyrinomonadaceae bacterium]|nr:thioredoxin domain-containing protein [Pyrinomonadaceae bacterium]